MAYAIARWLAIAALLAGWFPAAAVWAAPAPQGEEPADEPPDHQLYLPLTFGSGSIILRDDLLAAESNLTVLSVSAGFAHACAVLPDSRLICWGLDASGQSSPLPGEYRAVSAGDNHTCAIRTDGTLACWGDNTYGQATPPSGVFDSVSAGGYHTCGLRPGGELLCWGWNAFAQLDNIPTGVFRQVSAGNLHTCALRDDNRLACWGWNADGQTDAPDGSFSQVSAGGSHSCAVRADGSLACWGWNLVGQANAPAGTFRHVSTGSQHTCALQDAGEISCWGSNTFGQQVDIPDGAFGQISAGGSHTCAVRDTGFAGGTLACWGWNRYGQSLPPSGVLISAGDAHACAVRADGSLNCWGENESGQTVSPPGVFTRVSAGDQHSCAVSALGTLACWGSNAAGQAASQNGVFLDVSAGGAHTCALAVDGTLACWGSNSAGQTSAPAGVFSQISAGGAHSCALRPDGSLACWGSASAGQTSAPAGSFVQISAGGEHSCALTSSGTLACWGSNSAGQASTLSGTFAQVSAGARHTCAVRADGSLACWGDNAFGQSNAPEGIFSQVSAGGQHTCAVPLDGSVLCWGGVLQPADLVILPESLPDAQVGAAYSQTFSATGGTPPYTFTVSEGALPAGLELSAEGQLSGTPTADGSYPFTIQARDSAAFTAAGQRAYTLLVSPAADSTPPVISAKVSGPQGSAGWYVGPVTVTWTVSDPESPITEQSGCETTTLREDTAGVTLTCRATSAGGSSAASVTVKIDQTAPEKVTAKPERKPDSNGWYNHALKITFSGTDALSGIDSCTRVVYDGPDAAKASVSGTCTDAAGNTSAPVTFTFQYDSTPPELNPVVKPNPVFLNGEAQVIPNASDALSGLDAVKCETPDTSTVGLKKVTCGALDKAGNWTKASAAYSVIYRFLGFFPPVANPPDVNVVVAGQNVPIKFAVADDQGAPVSGLVDYEVRVEQVSCPISANMLDLVEADEIELNPVGSGGTWFYHYNWKTSPDLARSCVRLTVDLGEGPAADHYALFYFRK